MNTIKVPYSIFIDHMSDIPRSGNSSRAGGAERQVCRAMVFLEF